MGVGGLTVIGDPRFREYDFGPDHPWNPHSRWMAVRLLEAWEAESRLAAPLRWEREIGTATDAELLRFHSRAHVARIRAAEARGGGEMLDRGDTPSFPGCFTAAARLVRGTLTGLEAIQRGDTVRAFQPAGGLHHAGRDAASGFCIFNDVAIALATAVGDGGYRRAAYVDLDVHHGDGVMYGFYDDGRILDIDFHETGASLFPGTGEIRETGKGEGAGLKVNVPLPPGAGDEEFVPLFHRVVPTMIRRYRPEILIVQCGVDAHAGDGLGHLQYSTRAYIEAITTLRGLADEVCGGRLLVTGGGGYDPENVAVTLALVGAELSGGPGDASPTGPLPAVWREEYRALLGTTPPRSIALAPSPLASTWTSARQARTIEQLESALGVRFDAPM